VSAPPEARTAALEPPRTGIVLAVRSINVARLRAISILVGGAAGALARAGVARALPHHGAQWPWATFIVNLAGALLLGWLTTRLAEHVAPTRYWRFLIGTGFCGALTTFSTFQVETIRLAKDGHPGVALAYATASLALGMACAIGGTLLARRRRYG
jgi:fluoride exporter